MLYFTWVLWIKFLWIWRGGEKYTCIDSSCIKHSDKSKFLINGYIGIYRYIYIGLDRIENAVFNPRCLVRRKFASILPRKDRLTATSWLLDCNYNYTFTNAVLLNKPVWRQGWSDAVLQGRPSKTSLDLSFCGVHTIYMDMIDPYRNSASILVQFLSFP